jgi:anti-sigma factor RsiW
VKPWFQGRVDYAPPVFDLAGQGFPLVGGRIEHLRGGAVATLAYARNRHMIDVFVWPSAAQSAPVRSVHKGFNVLHWADGSMQYWAVSDLERAEMERFAQAWRQQVAAQ